MVWLADLRETIAAGFAPLAFVWEGVEWLLGEAGGIVLLPIAWLTIAGVVYGQAVAPERLKIRVAALDGIRSRYSSVPSRIRSRLTDLWASVTARFRPIGAALVLMWRAGPVLVGSYVLLYTVLLGLESLVNVGVTRLVGPHELAFWFTHMNLITLAVPFVIEPIRVSIVSGAYDAVVGRLVVRNAHADSAKETDAAPPAREVAADSESAADTAPGPVTAPPAAEPAPATPRRSRRRP
jgi:hypothetical protein